MATSITGKISTYEMKYVAEPTNLVHSLVHPRCKCDCSQYNRVANPPSDIVGRSGACESPFVHPSVSPGRLYIEVLRMEGTAPTPRSGLDVQSTSRGYKAVA